MVSVYGFYHGKSTCFTTIWKNMFDSLFPTTLAKKIWKYLVRKSINQPAWWFFWNFLPNRSVQPVVAFGWRLGNETDEVLFITANQPSPEPPPKTYPAGNKAEIKGLLSLGGWLISHDFMVREWGLKLHHSQEALRALKRCQSVGYEGLRNLPLPLPAWQPLSWRPALEVEHAFTTRIVRLVTGALRRRLEILLDVVLLKVFLVRSTIKSSPLNRHGSLDFHNVYLKWRFQWDYPGPWN